MAKTNETTDLNDLITVALAAEILGVSRQRVPQLDAQLNPMRLQQGRWRLRVYRRKDVERLAEKRAAAKVKKEPR